MDALKSIRENVPDWLKRLDELGNQIEQRQVELAAVGIRSTPSMKNKGSTESLKLKDPVDADKPTSASPAAARQRTPPGPDANQKENDTPSSPGSSASPSAIQKTTQQAVAVAQARARAQVKKQHKSDSLVSADNVPSKYRSRSMIIVYYDSYVQGFFEELVKFVSASRNLMRKAKMAAKVAQIRRLAELEAPDDKDGNGELKPDSEANDAQEPLPSLRYMSTRRMGVSTRYSRGGKSGGLLGDQEKDAYDDLDKGLEFVQATSEHAAHQFLRDGDCQEEIDKIKTRLAETKDLANKEYERIEKEDPDLLKESNEPSRARTHRPASMRRDLAASKDITPSSFATDDGKIEASSDRLEPDTHAIEPAPPILAADEKIEADDAALEVDEGVDGVGFTMPPKLQYRSTRAMRSQPRV